MNTAYIVDAVRTAGGRRGGRLAGVHPVDLLARSLDAIVDRTGIAPDAVDDVITGCVTQAGEQAMQVGRMGVLSSKLADSTPAVTIDRQCGSSQQAIQFAAQAVMSGTQDVVIASGVESMTRVPMGSNAMFHMKEGLGHYMSPELQAKYPGIQFSQFMGAEMIVKKHGFTKDDLDRFAYESHKRAIAATEADWGTEYLDAIISVKMVDGVDGAIAHIETYGSHHTDSIVTDDATAAEKFLNELDSAILLHNASTQFADGGEFGMGAEIGISTDKLHARGPVGVEQLTSYKYVVHGAGQTRP